MEKKVESGIRCIEMADTLLNECKRIYYVFQEDKDDMSIDDYNNNERILGALFGLVSEYYLKGLWLPYVRLTIPDDAPELQVIVDNITPEQEYRLLIGDKAIIQELNRIHGIPEKKIRKLMEQSLRKIGGNGHDLSYFIGTQFLSENNREIKLPTEVRKEIYKGISGYFSDNFTPKNREEWEDFLKDFYIIDDENHERTARELQFENLITDRKVKDAFFSRKVWTFRKLYSKYRCIVLFSL